MKKTTLSILVLCVVYLASCIKGVDEVAKQNENEQAILDYMAANNLTATADTLGMYTIIRDFNAGARKMGFGDSVKVNYEIFLLDGTRALGNEAGTPLEFIQGYAPLFGIDLALGFMRVGEKATALIPYYLAFGNNGSSDGRIPAYAPIRLELEIVASKSENEQIAEFIQKNGYTPGLVTPENLNIIWLNKIEEGDTLGMGKNVTVAYRGSLLSGTKFDEGAYPFLTGSTGINSNAAIKGFDRGVRKMKLGEKAILVFPSALGYGHQGTSDGSIPPFAPLTFEVEVTKVD